MKPLKTPKPLKLQVPWLVQLPGTADRPALSHGKPDIDFNFRLAVCNLSVLHQRHLDFSSCVTASTALYNWLSKRTDVLEEVSFLNAHLLRDLKLFIVDNSEDSCYFNDGNAEDCYFNDSNTEGCYFNDDNFKKGCYFNGDNEEVATLPSLRRL